VTRLSFSRAWDETRAILARDGRLLWPIALMTLVVPQLLIGTVVGPGAVVGLSAANQGGQSVTLLIGLILVAIARFGGLTAIAQLALRSDEQVGEALRSGLRRAPAVLGATLLVLFPLMILIAPALLPVSQNQQPSPGAALLFLIGLVVGLVIFARLQFAIAVAAAEGGGPLRLLGRSWRLSKGQSLRLIGFLFLFLALLAVVALTLSSVLGSVILLTLGKPDPMTVSALLLGLIGLVGEALVLVPYSVMLARLYAQAAQHQASVPHAP